jgi:hypothetical protein
MIVLFPRSQELFLALKNKGVEGAIDVVNAQIKDVGAIDQISMLAYLLLLFLF